MNFIRNRKHRASAEASCADFVLRLQVASVTVIAAYCWDDSGQYPLEVR